MVGQTVSEKARQRRKLRNKALSIGSVLQTYSTHDLPSPGQESQGLKPYNRLAAHRAADIFQ